MSRKYTIITRKIRKLLKAHIHLIQVAIYKVTSAASTLEKCITSKDHIFANKTNRTITVTRCIDDIKCKFTNLNLVTIFEDNIRSYFYIFSSCIFA